MPIFQSMIDHMVAPIRDVSGLPFVFAPRESLGNTSLKLTIEPNGKSEVSLRSEKSSLCNAVAVNNNSMKQLSFGGTNADRSPRVQQKGSTGPR